ncbi:hypothetical protein M8C21_011769 [Ambrosia artemisiifolia]|uniref:Uncharacterized protein n=1 Tax=Ambrosia artemisiifolia TaxID=4212 RepID=A0AAD5GP02_AMBAR|nr:hypothetical protein M8C21_011769 [Ambrosia artemisiifolia]
MHGILRLLSITVWSMAIFGLQIVSLNRIFLEMKYMVEPIGYGAMDGELSLIYEYTQFSKRVVEAEMPGPNKTVVFISEDGCLGYIEENFCVDHSDKF